MSPLHPGLGDRGFVLINALILVAALSFVTVRVLREAQDNMAFVGTARDAANAELLTDAAVAYAGDLLQRDWQAGRTDHLAEDWVLQDATTAGARGDVRITVRDLQGRFNLNALAALDTEVPLTLFAALAERQGVSDSAVDAIAARLADSGPGPEGSGGAQVPTDFRELTLIAGVGAADIDRLASVATVLPQGFGLNVNTAAPKVMAAVFGDSAEALVERRMQAPIDSVFDLRDVLDAAGVPMDQVAVSSDWFEVETLAKVGNVALAARTILYRAPDTGRVRRHLRRPGPPE